MTYPFICIVCYIIVTLIKRTSIAKEWLPLLSGCTGALLALVGYFAFPQFVQAASALTAAFSGAVSGLAATGGDQVFRQAIKLFCKRHGLDYDCLKSYLEKENINHTSAMGVNADDNNKN